jgi:hypothetical protein
LVLKISVKTRKRIIILLSVIAGVILIGVAGSRIAGRMLQKHHISFEELSFQFPSTLKVEGLVAAPDERFYLELARLEVGWKWGSLIRKRPIVTHLSADSGRVVLKPGPVEESEGSMELPRLTLHNVHLSAIHLDLYADGDTLLLQLGSLGIPYASVNRVITVDQILLQETSLAYLQAAEGAEKDTLDSAASSEGSFFTSIPEFEIGALDFHQCELLLEGVETTQHVGELELSLSGWKSSDLLNVQVERLGFIYQDTIEMELVLENGKVNETFHTDLSALSLHVPGISLNVEELEADLQEGPHASVTMADSYISLGRIRQFYPGIDSILHPSLPGTTLFYLNGEVELEGEELAIRSFMISMLDSTSLVLSGSVEWSEKPSMAVKIDPLRSTRSNLVRLLAEANYHRFYLWPTDMDGEIHINGPLDQIDITGSLDSNEGLLHAHSMINTGPSGNLFFMLDIWSDSVQVDHVTELLPMPVPHGQLRYYMELKESEQEPGGSLWIRITSDHLYAFDHYIHNVEYNYFGDDRIDSMHAAIDDSLIRVMADLVTPTKGDGTTYFSGDLGHLVPSAFQASLPEGSVSTRLYGSFLFEDTVTRVALELDSTTLSDEWQIVPLPGAKIELLGRGDRYSLRAESGGEPFLEAETESRFPEFGFPLPQWLSSWPDTDLEMHMKLEEELVSFLTGSRGSIEVKSFTLKKEHADWSFAMDIPHLSYQENHIEQFQLELHSNPQTLHGAWKIDTLYNESLHLEGIVSMLGTRDNQYWLSLENSGSRLIGKNRIALVMEDLDSMYNIRLNDTVPLLIKDEEWMVELNRGIHLDDRFRLLSGDFGLRNGSSRLEAGTNGTVVQATIDSVDLDPLLTYFTEGELIRGTLNAQAEVNTSNMAARWVAEIVAFNDLVPDPAMVEVEGNWSGEMVSAHLEFTHEDALASADLSTQGGAMKYEAQLNHFNLRVLQYIPGLSEEIEVTGRLTGGIAGSLTPEIEAEGSLVAEEVTLVPRITGAPIRLAHDTLILAGNRVLLKDFRLTDARGTDLVIEGTVDYSPELWIDLRVRSDQFAMLQERGRDSRIQGDMNAMADLTVRGGTDELAIAGTLETLPGASVKYVSEKSFDMVDASQIVTFMDLEETKENVAPPVPQGMHINWNVDLKMDEVTFEMLLDEIDQEFIRITSQGNLNLRSGENELPMVYGTITSTNGHAFIKAPAVPDLDLIVEQAVIHWTGLLDEPVISFRGYKIVKGVTSGLSTQLDDNSQLVDYKVYVILDRVTLSEFDLEFDLEVEDSEAQIFLATLPRDTRENYALNLLVFGRIGTEKIKGNAMLANQITGKLNELSRRNLKNAGLYFSSANYKDRSDGISERERTDLSYNLSRGFLDNRLNVSVGGSVGFYMDDLTMLPPTHLIGDVELSYRLSDHPVLILKGSRKNIYEGIIDGMIMQESVGLTFQKSYPRFPLMKGGSNQEKGATEQ